MNVTYFKVFVVLSLMFFSYLVLLSFLFWIDRIRPICLSDDGKLRTENIINTNPFVAGWGFTTHVSLGSHNFEYLHSKWMKRNEIFFFAKL